MMLLLLLLLFPLHLLAVRWIVMIRSHKMRHVGCASSSSSSLTLLLGLALALARTLPTTPLLHRRVTTSTTDVEKNKNT